MKSNNRFITNPASKTQAPARGEFVSSRPFAPAWRIVNHRLLLGLICALASIWQSTATAAPVQWAENGHFYEAVFVGGTGISWLDARSAAHSTGGYLASINSASENAFVYSLVSDAKFWKPNWTSQFGLGPWLGGYQTDNLAEPGGHWAWDSGETWDYVNWASGEPNNLHEAEDYLHFYGFFIPQSSEWNDLVNLPSVYQPSEAIMGYVVEMVPEPSPLALLATGFLSALAYIRRQPSNRSLTIKGQEKR